LSTFYESLGFVFSQGIGGSIMARILVIDDDAGLRQMVKLMLEREGHEAILAENGQMGIDMALSQVPDVAIIDLMMPGLSGYDVTRQLRTDSRTSTMPILILTARSQPMDKQMATSAGASAFMSKPVASRELASRLTELLESQSSDFPSTATSPVTPMPSVGATPAPPSPIKRLPIGVDHAEAAPPRSAATIQPLQAARASEKTLPAVAVLSVRGGSGGTTLAINLTFMFRRIYERVCLVDLSMAGGQIGLYLHLPLRGSWADLLPLGDQIEPRAVSGVITAHPQQGVGIIGAPTTPPAGALTPAASTALLTTLSTGFQQTVIDINGVSAGAGAILGLTRTVIVILSDDPVSAQMGSSLSQNLQAMNVDIRRVRIVVNHSRPEPGIPAATIARSIGLPIHAELPYDVNQMQAIRRGVPTVVLAPESAYAQALYQLTRTL
jgi:DNA-binding response OmpR family regulator/MinD-like ATPase involved in chromosome partitioning or flagellar assembly